LTSSDLKVGLSYRIQNGRDMDKVLEYKGRSGKGGSTKSSLSHYFTCEFGTTWCLALDFYDCYTITGPVPKKTDMKRSVSEESWEKPPRKEMPFKWVEERFAKAVEAAAAKAAEAKEEADTEAVEAEPATKAK